MKLAANPSETVGAGIEVVANSLTLIVSDSEVGVWPLNRIEVDVEEDGFHVQVDGEEFVFVTREAEEFARAVGVLDRSYNGTQRTATAPRTKPAKPATARPPKPAKALRTVKPTPSPKTRKARSSRRRLNLADIDFGSRQVQLAIAGLVLAAVMAIFAAPLLAFLIMAAGSIGLLVGTGSLIDPIMATRLPAELPPPKMILVSTLLIVTGMTILTFI
ncbi:MAG: hypothetical protein ACRDWA_16455 [Acidimicrobiia bacterium]